MRCNRCDDSPDYDRDELAAHAVDSGHPRCVVCLHSLHGHEPQTCDRCVARIRDLLADITDLYAELPDSLDRPNPSKHQHPGGDPLVMLAWGSEGAQWAGRGDPPAGNDNWPSDPPSIAWQLARWEDDWRTTRGEPAVVAPPESKRRPESRVNRVFHGAVHYEQRHLQWAANMHPAFDEYAADLRALRRKLQQATTHHDRPEVGAPCFECREPLQRTWEDPSQCEHARPDLRLLPVLENWTSDGFGTQTVDVRPETIPERDARIHAWERDHRECKQGGRGEIWECPRCGLTYDDDAYRLALRAQLESAAVKAALGK